MYTASLTRLLFKHFVFCVLVWWFLVHLQACRALMILSLLVGLASIIVSVLGLKCTKIGRTSEHVKDQIALTGGILFILSGM